MKCWYFNDMKVNPEAQISSAKSICIQAEWIYWLILTLFFFFFLSLIQNYDWGSVFA